MENKNQKIIVLGDSFAEINPNIDYLWQNILSKKLELDLVNIAQNGASSEWMMLKIAEYIEHNLEPDDLLILILPYWERVCIWPDHPDLNSIFPIESVKKDWVESIDDLPEILSEKLKHYSVEERRAFQYYFHYLKNEDLILTRTLALLNWFNNLSCKLKNKPLIFDSHKFVENFHANLHHCSVANGSLFEICENEFQSKELFEEYTNKGPFNDFRIGHMSPCNHEVLANKILDYFSNNDIPDLTSGFHEKIVKKEDVPVNKFENKSLFKKIRNLF